MARPHSSPRVDMFLFNRIYHRVIKQIPFNRRWLNRSERLHGVIDDPIHKLKLKPGEAVKLIDSLDRRVVVVHTGIEVMVFYKTTLASRPPAIVYYDGKLYDLADEALLRCVFDVYLTEEEKANPPRVRMGKDETNYLRTGLRGVRRVLERKK